MKLLFGTGNQFKYELMKDRLKGLKDIEVIIPKMLGISIDVVEDGKTPEENAYKKAKAYYDATKMPTIAEDSGLFIDKFKRDEQPGLFVKRVHGREDLTNEEILDYYIDMLRKYEGRSLAHYYSGVCIINEDGDTCSDVIEETDFLLTTKKCKKVSLKGSILNCISYDLDAEKYFDERNEEEIKEHYQELDDRYRELVNSVLRNNQKVLAKA